VDVVSSVMPVSCKVFRGRANCGRRPGRRRRTAGANIFAFESAVLKPPTPSRQDYYRLWFLDEKIRVDREMLRLLSELERIARAQNETGQATLQDVVSRPNRRGPADHGDRKSRRFAPAVAGAIQGGMGLTRDQPDPPQPGRFEVTTLDLPAEQILDTAFARNPELKAMEAEVRRAQTSLDLAYKAKVPDFSLGLMADVKMRRCFTVRWRR